MVDNFFTGRRRNVEHWIGHENFELIHQDVIEPLYIEVDQIYHLACPASPPHYMYNPIKTIKVNYLVIRMYSGKTASNCQMFSAKNRFFKFDFDRE